MKINFKSKKIIILIIVGVITLIFSSAFGYRYYQQQKLQKKIDTAIAKIENTETDFSKEDTREDKFALLQSISKEYSDYEKSKNMIKEIDEKYRSVISDMKKVFKEEYDKTLVDNTLNDIDKIIDKEQLNNAKIKLNELLQSIQNEKDIVCTENEVKEYETKITDLVKSYENRVTAIEQEEQAKEEAERKSAEEEAKRQNNSSNKNKENASSNKGGSSSGSSNSSSSNGSSNRPWNYGMTYYWYIDENGVKKEWYEDSQGNSYDLNGNYLGVSW